MLALKIVPSSLQALVIRKTSDINPAVTGPAETLYRFVFFLKAEMSPFLDEQFPLLGRIQKNLLLGRDERSMQACAGVSTVEGAEGTVISEKLSFIPESVSRIRVLAAVLLHFILN